MRGHLVGRETLICLPFRITFWAMGLALSSWLALDPRPDLVMTGWFHSPDQGVSARLAKPFMDSAR
jgi:hypothetical protein